MEEKTISLNAETILKKKFTPNVKGYDPNEVDEFLDCVMEDYRGFESYYKESKAYIVDLERQLRQAKESISQLTLDNAKMKSRLAGVKDSTDVNSSNLEYLNRIDRLERALWELGVNPTIYK